jgi:RNA polymerase primary sigma factor
MQIDHHASRLVATPASPDELHGFAVELHDSREALIATILGLPPGCREHVVNGEETAAHNRRYWPYEGLENCCDRLRSYGSEHSDPEIQQVVEQAQRSRRSMNRAREALIMANLGIVPFVVKEYHRGMIPMSDLVQEGYLGLLRAVDRFDPNRGTKFSTYASWWIRRALNDAFTDRARLIRLPESVRRELRRYREVARELKEELERPPTDDEVAQRSGISVKKLKRLRNVAPDPCWLEEIATTRDDGWQAVVGETSASDPFEATLKGEMHGQAIRALEQLSPRERRIIEMRFGFEDEDEKGKTLKQIAGMIGVSRERVRQIESVALDKIARWARRARITSCGARDRRR